MTLLPTVRPQSGVYTPTRSATTLGELTVATLSSGCFLTVAFTSSSPMFGTPALLRENAVFQPLVRPCSSPRWRSAPIPSGAPVSLMSKKSPLMPATAASAVTMSRTASRSGTSSAPR